MPNLGLFENCELNIPFERAYSKLSENHKNIEIGPTELELWSIKSRCVYIIMCKYILIIKL